MNYILIWFESNLSDLNVRGSNCQNVCHTLFLYLEPINDFAKDGESWN